MFTPPEAAASLVDAGASYQPVPRELASNDVIIDMLQDLTQLEPLLTGPDGKRLATRDRAETLAALRARGVTPEAIKHQLGFA